MPGCERASLDFRFDTMIPRWIPLRNSGTKFINRLLLYCAVLCLASRIPELGREQREENKGSLLIFFSEALCLDHSARSASIQC